MMTKEKVLWAFVHVYDKRSEPVVEHYRGTRREVIVKITKEFDLSDMNGEDGKLGNSPSYVDFMEYLDGEWDFVSLARVSKVK